MSSKDTSSKDTSSKDTSSKDTSSKDTSSKDTSSQDLIGISLQANILKSSEKFSKVLSLVPLCALQAKILESQSPSTSLTSTISRH